MRKLMLLAALLAMAVVAAVPAIVHTDTRACDQQVNQAAAAG